IPLKMLIKRRVAARTILDARGRSPNVRSSSQPIVRLPRHVCSAPISDLGVPDEDKIFSGLVGAGALLWTPRARPMSSRISADDIRLKRAYEPPASDDGIRILIDRLWPRGVKKSDAAIDEWMKEIAPSTKLRKWFSHDPERWQEFRRRYQTEIRHHPDEFERL